MYNGLCVIGRWDWESVLNCAWRWIGVCRGREISVCPRSQRVYKYACTLLITGLLQPGYKRLCCGGEIVSNQTRCCGNSTIGQAYLPQSGYDCCGQVYTQVDTSLCCKTSTDQTKVHFLACGPSFAEVPRMTFNIKLT